MADTGHNVEFAVEGATPGTFEQIGAVQSITFPGVTRGTVDVTTLTSPMREFIGTVPEAGEVEVVIFWDEGSAEQEALLESVEDPDTRRGVNYQVTFPSGTTWQFKAIPIEATPSQATVDDVKTLTFRAKLTGSRGTIAVA